MSRQYKYVIFYKIINKFMFASSKVDTKNQIKAYDVTLVLYIYFINEYVPNNYIIVRKLMNTLFVYCILKNITVNVYCFPHQ